MARAPAASNTRPHDPRMMTIRARFAAQLLSKIEATAAAMSVLADDGPAAVEAVAKGYLQIDPDTAMMSGSMAPACSR